MSRQLEMNHRDEHRECELCKANVLKSESGCFGILQNCENVFCLECAGVFWKVGTLSKRNVAKVGYYVCPICGKKSYMLASSYYFVADPEEKKVFFDEYLKSTGSFVCEFCKKPRSNCSHSIYDEKKPVLKFGMESNHLLSPEMLLERSQACKVEQNHQSSPILAAHSYHFSVLNNKQARTVTTSEADENCSAPESSSLEIDVFSAEDFPLLEGKNIGTDETFSSTTGKGEPGRKLYSQVSQENELMKTQTELVPFIHLPSEYTKVIPDECRIETASSLAFLPEDIVPIYTAKKLQASYDKSSLKAMNLHHVLKKKYINQNMQDVKFYNRFLPSDELFSIFFSSSCFQEDSVVKLWSANGATGSSTTRPKYPALSKYLTQLEMIPSEKNNPLIPIIKFATNLAPVSQDQNRRRVERVCERIQNSASVQHVNITDNCYRQLDMESQPIDSSKIIHVMFHKKLRNIHSHKESETKCNLEDNLRNSVNNEICYREDNLTSEVGQSKCKSLPVSFSSSIQTLSSDLTSEEFHFTPKCKSANNGEVLLKSELEKKQHCQSVKYLQEQPNNSSTLQLDYETRGQEDYFLTTYLHPYQQIVSVRCKMESQENLGTNLIKYYHVEPRAEGGLSLNPNNAAESIDYTNSQRQEDQTNAQLKLLSRLETSYKETQTIFFREEMNRFGSGEITFGNNFQRNCNVQSLTESPVFQPLENASSPIQNASPSTQKRGPRRRSNKKKNSEKQVSSSETTFQPLQTASPPIQNSEMRRRSNINQNSEKQVSSSETTFKPLQNAISPIQNPEKRRRSHKKKNSEKQVSSSETTFQPLQTASPPIQNPEKRRRSNTNQNSEKQLSSSETTFQPLQNTFPPIQNQEMRQRTNINQNSEKQVSSSETASGQADKENKKIQ